MRCSYREILDNIKWSFSTLRCYDDCPYCFYMKKIDGTELPESNFYAQSGSFMHEILADIASGKITVDEAINYYADNFENYVCYKVKDTIMENKYNKALDYLAELDISDYAKYDVLGVEMKVEYQIGKYKFIGFIDLLLRDKETREIIIVDHKSLDPFYGKRGNLLKAKEKEFYAYRKQMYLYSIAVKDKYGEYPTKIVWNHFYDNSFTVIPFCEQDLKESKEWAIYTIDQIYADSEFKAQQSYMTCKVLCDYRNCCDYNEE